VIAQLYNKRQDFEIYLVGDGIDFAAIKIYAAELDIENKVVFFTGMLTGEDLVRAYQQSHFSVLFSNYENIPVVISESFACGLPVVSTKVGGIAEHINDSNGILLNPNDEQALFESLDFMLDHYKDYISKQMKEMAHNKYSYSAVGNELLSIYKNILKQ
jgi:glycosyltransferase involved in cell wall biosynthesis